MSDALFQPDGRGLLTATERARSPWSPESLHGGPVAALVARAAEAVESPGPMDPARLTLELLKPVPTTPLAVSTEVRRSGRMVQLVEVEVSAGEVAVARGQVLRLRRDDSATTAAAGGTATGPPPFPDEPAAPVRGLREPDQEWAGFHNTGVEHRFAAGGFHLLGPATDWIRLTVPVVTGEEPSPFQRVVAAADFANGISAVLAVEEATFINPDLTVHLHRPAQGEWIGLASATSVGPHGIAVSSTDLFDRQGLIGVSAQSLLIQPPPGR